jgi:hypothetical protein
VHGIEELRLAVEQHVHTLFWKERQGFVGEGKDADTAIFECEFEFLNFTGLFFEI